LRERWVHTQVQSSRKACVTMRVCTRTRAHARLVRIARKKARERIDERLAAPPENARSRDLAGCLSALSQTYLASALSVLIIQSVPDYLASMQIDSQIRVSPSLLLFQFFANPISSASSRYLFHQEISIIARFASK